VGSSDPLGEDISDFRFTISFSGRDALSY